MVEREDRIRALETTVENLEELVGGAYQSIRAYKAVCITLALLLAGGAVAGLVGLFQMLKAAERIQTLRVAMEEDVDGVHAIREELRTANAKVLQEVWETVPDVLGKLEKDIAARMTALEAQVDGTIGKLQERSGAEIKEFRERLQTELDALDLDLQKAQTILRSISDVFVAAEKADQALLTAREKQLLMILAREMNPGDPSLTYAAADWAVSLGSYDRALELLAALHEMPGADTAVLVKGDALRKRAIRLREQHRALRHESPGRTRVGPYGVFELHYYTLLRLIENGTLTVAEAQEILDKSKTSLRSASAQSD